MVRAGVAASAAVEESTNPLPTVAKATTIPIAKVEIPRFREFDGVTFASLTVGVLSGQLSDRLEADSLGFLDGPSRCIRT